MEAKLLCSGRRSALKQMTVRWRVKRRRNYIQLWFFVDQQLLLQCNGGVWCRVGAGSGGSVVWTASVKQIISKISGGQGVVFVSDCYPWTVMTSVNLEWHKSHIEFLYGSPACSDWGRIMQNLIGIWFRKWPKSNLKRSDSMWFSVLTAIRSGSHRGELIRFKPLGPAVWSQSNCH